MTMLLVMEAIDEGKLKPTDKVMTSEYAASMGGSQIFLEPGEEMTVDEMMKGIAMASGNDASVAMAEKVAGSEKAFVQMMNEKAKELGMKDTHFENSNGLPADNHYTSAYDIALMSQALLQYPGVTKYTGLTKITCVRIPIKSSGLSTRTSWSGSTRGGRAENGIHLGSEVLLVCNGQTRQSARNCGRAWRTEYEDAQCRSDADVRFRIRPVHECPYSEKGRLYRQDSGRKRDGRVA